MNPCHINKYKISKSGKILEEIFDLISTSRKCVKSLSLNFSKQGENFMNSDFANHFENGTKFKILSDIKPPFSFDSTFLGSYYCNQIQFPDSEMSCLMPACNCSRAKKSTYYIENCQ